MYNVSDISDALKGLTVGQWKVFVSCVLFFKIELLQLE